MPSSRPPYASYAAIMSAFGGLLATAGAIGRLLDRDPHCQTALDFGVLAAASFKAAHTLSHDEVTSFLRQPFVRGTAHSGEGEEPAEEGLEQAIGELVTCSRCVGMWVAAGLATTQIVAPRFGRLLTWTLATGAVNDWLQTGFAALRHKSNELERRASA